MTKRQEWMGRVGKAGERIFVSAAAMREEVEALAKLKMEKLAQRLDLVTRAEFEAVDVMVRAARRAQEKMEARIAELESQISKPKKTKPIQKKTGGKKLPSKRGTE